MSVSHLLILSGLDARFKRASSPHLLVAALLLIPCSISAAVLSAPPAIAVGQNLQTPVKLSLDSAAPKDGFVIHLKSDDSNRLLLSDSPEKAGVPEISVRIPEGWSATPEFWVHGLSDRGDATYTASATGLPSLQASVRLTASGFVVSGPARFQPIKTSSGSYPIRITLASASLDGEGKFVSVQALRGGLSVKVGVASSNPAVAAVSPSVVTMNGGVPGSFLQLKPASNGTTEVVADVPEGFHAPSQYKAVPVTVALPGLGITEQFRIGGNLEAGGSLTLGEAAPATGLEVTLTSADPTRLLLSLEAGEPGKPEITVKVAAGGSSAVYFLQALADSGMAPYTARAPGYSSRTGAVELTPSGFIITGPIGPPHEAELFRPNEPPGPNGFRMKKSSTVPMDVVIYAVQLEPKTKRCADLTVQRLRPGMNVKVEISNSNSAVGPLVSSVVVRGGTAETTTTFTPKTVGKTLLSIIPPTGFTVPSNATTLEAIVEE